MRILFAGTPAVALPVLQDLVNNPEHEVVGVLTRADARQGRGRTLRPSPVAAFSREIGIDTRTPSTLKDAQVQEWIRSLAADIAIVVAYGRLVPPELLAEPAYGWLNLHFSLLPAWRGAAPVQHAVIAGDDVTGACIFRLEKGLDTGPIYSQLTETIRPNDTAGDLLDRLSISGSNLLGETLTALVADKISPVEQDDSAATYAPTLSSHDGLIDWTNPALALDRQIRGVTPAPGAHTSFTDKRFRLGPVELVPQISDLRPGELRVSKHEVLVGTGSHAIRLGQVAPAGKNWMNAPDWARGARPAEGSCLGDKPGAEQ